MKYKVQKIRTGIEMRRTKYLLLFSSFSLIILVQPYLSKFAGLYLMHHTILHSLLLKAHSCIFGYVLCVIKSLIH